jgi:hypothetical protein
LCGTQTTTINITAVNDAPVINSVAPTTATEDVLYTYNATMTDPDGPGQTWSLLPAHTCGGSIVAGTGAFSFTPLGPIPAASCVVAIQVCDGGTPNLCASQNTTVTIIAVNDPPIPTNPGTLAARVHIPITFPAATLGGTDPDLGVVTIDTVPTSVLAGATVTINADGSFTFSPPAEATGTVVGFAYRVCDNGNPGPGVCSGYQNVSFNLTGPTIYYVKTAAAGTGNCTLTNECTLGTALTNIGVLTGRTIFISDAAIYTQAVTLNNNGLLYGQGVTGVSFDAVFGTTTPPVGTIPARPAINATRPFITSSGTTVTLANGNTIRGLNLTSPSGPTLSGTNFGTLTASDVSITGGLPALSLNTGTAAATFDAVSSTGGTTGVSLTALAGNLTINGGAISGSATGFLVSGGTGTVSYAGTITSGAGSRTVNVTGKTGGTVTFSGAVTDNGTGISLTTNTGATINFTGGIAASTGTNAAFAATGGGTVSATQNNTTIVNTLATTTGTALTVTGTNIAATGLTFRSINAGGATGPTTGINLSNTGAAGGLTVVGNSAGSCGGAVVDKNTVATAPATADCTGGTIQNAATGIRLDNTANVSLTRMRITGTAAHNYGIYGTNVTGFTFNRSVIDGSIGVTTGGQDAPMVFGQLTTSNGLLGNNFITDSTISGGIEHNVELYGQSGNSHLTVTRTVVKSNSIGGGGDGIQMEMRGTATAFVLVDNSQFDDNKSQAIQAAANESSVVHFTLQNSRWSKGINHGNEGVVFSNGVNGQLFVDINNNLVPGTTTTGFGGTTIFVGQTPGNATAASQLHARIRNNVVTTPQTGSTNHTILSLLTSTAGAGAPAFVHIHDNTVTVNGSFNGIHVNTPDAGTNPNFHTTVLNNTVTGTDAVNGVNAISVNARQSSTACMHIANNNATVTAPAVNAVRARQQGGGTPVAVANLYDLPPTIGGNTAALELDANHTATNEVLGTIGLTNTICTAPTAPTLP